MSDYLTNKLSDIGLNISQINPKSIVIPEGKVYMLSPNDPKKAGITWIKDGGITVTPKSWDHLKKVIGLPDTISTRIPELTKPLNLSRVISPEVLKMKEVSRMELTSDALNLAKRYVYGNSRAYANYVPFLEEFFGKISIWVPVLQNITIEKNATLVIGQQAKTLLANNIYIKVGGKMKSQSDMLHIQCSSMQGNIK